MRIKLFEEFSEGEYDEFIREFQILTHPVFNLIGEVRDIIHTFEDDGFDIDIVNLKIYTDAWNWIPLKIDWDQEVITMNSHDLHDVITTTLGSMNITNDLESIPKKSMQLKIHLKNLGPTNIIDFIKRLKVYEILKISVSYKFQNYDSDFFIEYLESVSLMKFPVYILIEFKINDVL